MQASIENCAHEDSFWRKSSRALATGLIVYGQLVIILDLPKLGFLEHAMQRELRSRLIHFMLSSMMVWQLGAVAVALGAIWTILVLRDKVADRIIAALFLFTLVEIGCVAYGLTLGSWPGLSSGIK